MKGAFGLWTSMDSMAGYQQTSGLSEPQPLCSISYSILISLFPNCQRPSQTHTKPVASAKETAQMLAGQDHEIPSSVGWNALL